MNVSRTILTGLFGLGVSFALQAQDPGKELPLNPEVSTGTLSNGLTYYIQHNEKPENRAELRLVVKAGSILENDAQQGLAHFVEHMAFNGTKNFSKNELINFLERSGVRFGAHLNAYTSFDETVYMLSLPTDTVEVFKTGFQVLEDWAHNLSFNPEEIEKERGVVLEEWRLRLGAAQRMQQQYFPTLLYQSRYADRLPIGKPEIIENFEHPELISFYKDWYRPGLMAVIAVGDFDVAAVEALIKKHFGSISPVQSPRDRTEYTLPDHTEPQVSIVTDKEAQYIQLSVYYKRPAVKVETEADYMKLLERSLYNKMLNDRINEIRQQPDAPFLFAVSSVSAFISNKDAYVLASVPKEGQVRAALTTLLKENLRVQRFGFTPTELERAKTDILNSYENSWSERDKRENRAFIDEYINHFLKDEASPGIEFEYAFVKEHLDEIGVEELNTLAGSLISDSNRVVILTAPENQKDSLPSEEELLAILNNSSGLEVSPYEDVVADKPLFSEELSPAKIVSREQIEEIGVTKLELENGVEVFLKPTDFKNKEVLFRAYSPGGTSLYPDEDYLEAANATGILTQSGIAGFEEKVLRKLLEGKTVGVAPYISTLEEGFSGSANIDDIETLFQLTYLYFTQPRFDSDALKTWQARQLTFLQNKDKSPMSVYGDTLRSVMNSYAARYAPLTPEMVRELEFERMQEVYADRFADAGDFAFFLVGSFDLDSIQPLLQTYLGNLPSSGREESWKNLNISPPEGVISKEVYKGSEPQSRVTLVFTGQTDYDRMKNAQLAILGEALQIKLRESLREDAGGVYGVGVNTSISKFPEERYSVSVAFGCAPDNVEKLMGLVLQEIEKMKESGPLQSDLDKVIAIRKREHETALKENGYWISLLAGSYEMKRDPAAAQEFFEASLQQVSPDNLKKLAGEYFDKSNYIKVVLYPEKEKLSGN
ncbi:zinc protease [Anseongella ginsenosidimutans]|uniref:Zinc protease n=1 Tax=Anseongella ginsenosidimutans TaxID=496056 RepID=A0A4R3KU10_9SPHI|nr:M16 family metallopeptidase [Anseongella ginsenosidimutans]QEC51529.1 insulinase family protein [Anseongella ginsenosidimutans]TCS88847.1 zinc protease [Anseongella ginsenosidimutans]